MSDRHPLTVGPKGATMLYDVVQRVVSDYSHAGQDACWPTNGTVQPVPEVAS